MSADAHAPDGNQNGPILNHLYDSQRQKIEAES